MVATVGRHEAWVVNVFYCGADVHFEAWVGFGGTSTHFIPLIDVLRKSDLSEVLMEDHHLHELPLLGFWR